MIKFLYMIKNYLVTSSSKRSYGTEYHTLSVVLVCPAGLRHGGGSAWDAVAAHGWLATVNIFRLQLHHPADSSLSDTVSSVVFWHTRITLKSN